MPNSRPIYQLAAEGDSRNGWRFKMRSRAVFARREDAEAYMGQFKILCIDETFFESAFDNANLRISVIEFELFD